jgi:2-methylcitrate dehydratase PrpD
MTESERIAGYVTGFELADAPEAAVALAETGFVDTIGVMLAGSCEPAAQIAHEVIAAEGAAPAATVVGFATRSSPAGAALVNGTATQALDFDLSFMIGQSTAALIPALLPMAEATGAGAEDMLAGFITGTEVCAVLARCFPILSSEGGWHGAGVLGSVAAAAALARLTRQPAELIPATLGIAASMASGISANFGTMTKPLHAGLAARNAVSALALANAGFTGSADALAGQDGLFSCFAQGHPWRADPINDLGRDFALIDPGYKIKPFACGGLLHCSIEAALAIRDQSAPAADAIAHIVIGISQHAKNRAIADYPWSEDSSRFALRYLVAYALIHGAPGIKAFTEAGYDDDAVRALADKCEIVLDDEFASLTGSGYSPGRVTVTLGNGETLADVVKIPTGARETPMSTDQVKEKFASCAGRAIGKDRVAVLYDTLANLRGQKSLDTLWPMLAAGD